MRNAFLLARGLDFDALDDGAPRHSWPPAWSSATPTRWASRSARSSALGLDGVTVNLPANGHDPEAVAATVATLVKAVG